MAIVREIIVIVIDERQAITLSPAALAPTPWRYHRGAQRPLLSRRARRYARAMRLAALCLLTLAASSIGCGSDPVEDADPPSIYASAGEHPVGSRTLHLHDPARDRNLTVEVFYPAAESARAAADAGFPVDEFMPAGPDRDRLAALVAAAPDPATSRVAHSARDAEPASGGPFPVVAFSHCFNCTRYSTFTIAERLASHGVAVIAPDHAGGTLFDKLDGDAAPLDVTSLQTRAADVRFVLDRALDPAAAEVPASLRGGFDPERVGVYGHSFGAVTSGLVLMEDARPRAGLALAAPMENPLLPGVTVSELRVPLFFLVAAEDHSIGAIGNGIIDKNYDAATGEAYEATLADAGHWSVTDICGLTEGFGAGCEADVRQGDGEPFTYIDITEARQVTATYVTAFFAATLTSSAEGAATLQKGAPSLSIRSKAGHR